MEWLEALRGQVVGLDTAPLIYFIEENPVYLETVRPFFVAIDRGEFRVFQEIAEEAARLRAKHNIRTPDAIQMATAIHEGASFFLTNDARLPSLPTLQVLVLDELREEETE